MPQVEIDIGGRTFEVACQDGEEPFLEAAAAMLGAEASTLTSQIGRMPESRMLLMAGLMLADRTAAMEDKLREAEGREAALRSEMEAVLRDADAREIEMRAELDALRTVPPPEAEKVEVPVIPTSVSETLAEIAARAEALAEEVETRGGALAALTRD